MRPCRGAEPAAYLPFSLGSAGVQTERGSAVRRSLLGDDPRHRRGRPGDVSRSAVGQCVNAVERGTSRYGRTDVTQVTGIDRKRDGYKVKGRVVVTDGWRGRYGRGGSYDKGKFSCDVRYGRVVDVKYSGLR